MRTSSQVSPLKGESAPISQNEPCPIDDILEGAAQRVEELITNVQRFTATEILESARIRKDGRASRGETLRMSYVAAFEDLGLGLPTLREYRDNSTALPNFTTRIATGGTAASALIFHPFFAKAFKFSCERKTELHGTPAWQVNFVQLPGKSLSFRAYYIRDRWYDVRLKGRAWIAVDTNQILRIEHDLEEPIPEIQLTRDYVAVDYQLVRFSEHGIQIWLPSSSLVYIDLKNHHYLNTHRFTDYKLFWVDTHAVVTLPH